MKNLLIKQTASALEDAYGNGNEYAVSKMIRDWDANKRSLIEKLGNGLMISKTVKASETTQFEELRTQQQEFFMYVRKKSWSGVPGNFIGMMDFLYEAVDLEGFKNNRVTKDYSFEKEEGKVVKINKGAKFSRALKNFFDLKGDDKDEEETVLKEIQDQYSLYRQTLADSHSGKLFLSAHPLDYLTLSDNNHNWTSCHSIVEGEYGIGNLNYLADGVTLVAYFIGEEDNFDNSIEGLSSIKWNSKKWRMLVHLEEKNGELQVMYNKQYPYSDSSLLEEVDEMICSLYSSSEKTELMSYADYRQEGSSIYTVNDYYTGYMDAGAYSRYIYCRVNPLLMDFSSDYEPFRMEIGAPVYCLECGENITDNGENGLCSYCSDDFECPSCGGYYHEEDTYYSEYYDEHFCYDCYNEKVFHCPECGDEAPRDEEEYNRLLEKDLCKHCNQDFLDETTELVVNASAIILFSRNVKQEDWGELKSKWKENIANYHSKLKREGKRFLTVGAIVTDDLYFHEEQMGNWTASSTSYIYSDSNYYTEVDDLDFFDNISYESEYIPNIKRIHITGFISETMAQDFKSKAKEFIAEVGLSPDCEIIIDKNAIIGGRF